MIVKVKKLSSIAILPTKAYSQDAGWDLYYAGPEMSLQPNKRYLLETGIALEIPSGYVGIIKPRSGLATKYGIDVLAGVVDAGYRGEVKVALLNTGTQSLLLSPGDRIAQILFIELPDTTLVQANELSDSFRSEGGFGSSGV